MSTMKESFPLLDAPAGNPTGDGASEGDRIAIIGASVQGPDARSWTNISVLDAMGQPNGWVRSEMINQQGAAPLVPIGKADFARECWRKGINYGVNPHYLAAVAEMRSGTQNGPDGDRFGPYRFTAAEWDANRVGEQDFQLNFEPGDIINWRMQCDVFGLMAFRALSAFVKAHNKQPSAVQLYSAQLATAGQQPPPPSQIAAMLTVALDLTRPFVIEAAGDVLPGAKIKVSASQATTADVNKSKIPPGREAIAGLIVERFSQAGYGKVQQLAALANAIAESSLNPNAHNTSGGEDSVGLFQLNRNGGVGTGHAVEFLKVPENNIALIIREADKIKSFKVATALSSAVEIFVRQIERPADQNAEVIKRRMIAEQLLAA